MGRTRQQKKHDRAIVGIDPGGEFCGYGVLIADGETICYWDSGVWDLSTKRFEGGGVQMVRLATGLDRLLKDLVARFDEVHLVYERVRFHGDGNPIDAAHVYGAVVGQIMAVCEVNGVSYTGHYVTTSRKLVLKGNATKDEIRNLLESAYTDNKLLDAGDKKMKQGKNKGNIVKAYDESDALCQALGYIKAMQWAV